MTSIKVYNTFMTLFFDGFELLGSALLVATYFSQRKDCVKPPTEDENTQFLLHSVFER